MSTIMSVEEWTVRKINMKIFSENKKEKRKKTQKKKQEKNVEQDKNFTNVN